jgi:hypothetical protein
MMILLSKPRFVFHGKYFVRSGSPHLYGNEEGFFKLLSLGSSLCPFSPLLPVITRRHPFSFHVRLMLAVTADEG